MPMAREVALPGPHTPEHAGPHRAVPVEEGSEERAMRNGSYQIMPPLTAAEYAALKADIAAHGVQVAVEMDEEGHVLDGHHRVRACQELAIANSPSLVR